MRFDWNPDKAQMNEKKHDGVSFEEAVEVFYDENAVEDLTMNIRTQKKFVLCESEIHRKDC